MANAPDENAAVSAVMGMSLGNILEDMSLPGGSGLASRLGIVGLSNLDRSILNEKWEDDEDAVGLGVGEDWEDQIDEEMQNEPAEDAMNVDQPQRKEKQRRVRVVKRLVERPKTVYERFPDYSKDKILDFSELFKGPTATKSRLVNRPFHVETVYTRRKDIPRNFLESVVGDARRQVENKRVEEVVTSGNIEVDLRKALEDRENTAVPVTMPLHDRTFDLVLLSNWEEQIIYEPENMFPQAKMPESNSLTTPTNKTLESGDWTQSIIWSPDAPFKDFTQLEFNHEDDVIPEERVAETVRPKKRFRTDITQKDKFNLSNDHFYEVTKDSRHRVRQTFGQLVVEHAYPAQKLQLPFYKTRLSKQEARSFHRPALQFPMNIEIRFNKVRKAKKKKDKSGRKIERGGNVGEGLHRTGDLSLRDTSNFVLWEYSEEHPPILPNFGMGSALVNYYRKKDERDEYVPKFDLGVPFVLEPQDESPFMKFGYVYPGQTIPALYNNVIRAPLFRQQPYQTDFLVVKNTVKGDSKYFIREIKNLFVIGQTYPVTEVPGPHSRKITNTIKHRLQIIAVKLLRKSTGERLKISRLMKYFPDQNELQMRQRLKEFMEYHRRGPHQGFWRLKEGWNVPTDAEMLKMVTPEQVVLMESMQVGQRHLQDAGFGQTADAVDGDETNLSVEQQLAPWITTKNFLFATQAKAMLRLHGEGDPSGRGEAFSFIRISMKDIFVKAGEDYEQKLAEAENRPKSAHRYNVAEQQVIYKSEIERIWKAQFESLARKTEPQLTAEDEERYRNAIQKASTPAPSVSATPAPQPPPPPIRSQSFPITPYVPGMSPAPMMPMSPMTPAVATPFAAPSPAPMSRASSMDREGSLAPDTTKRVLRIKRLVDGAWQTEIIRDPAVILAYVRAKQLIEEETTNADSLAPTGDADKDKRAKKRLEEEIARMKKNQERRLHRKNAKIVKEGGTPMTLNRPLKPDTTRRCGHCGQMGHMKTNRKCPRWAEFNNGAAPLPATPSASLPTPATPTTNIPNLGFGRGPITAVNAPSPFGFPAAVSSPLATSPPVIASIDAPTASSSNPVAPPKIKLTLKGRGG